MNVIIFSRVSTNIQDYKRQTDELRDFAESQNWTVCRVFEEKISGNTPNDERPVLLEMVSFIEKNNINKILCWELSRIGRNSIQVLQSIELFTKLGISLFIKNYNLETLNENGDVNPLSQFMVQILNSVNEMERNTIRMRMKSGYERYLSNGGTVGRKLGFRKDDETILQEYKDVVKLIKKGYSVRKVMKLTDRSSGTIQKIKRTCIQMGLV